MGIRVARLGFLMVALGTSLPGWSATNEARTQQAHAISALISAGLRIPAERQMADFQALAVQPEDQSLTQVLRFLYLDRFITAYTPAERPARDAELARLREQITRWQQSDGLSAISRAVLARGMGTTLELVNTIARVIHPDAAPPLVPLAPEKIQRLEQQVKQLAGLMTQEFQRQLVTVQSHEQEDLAALDLPDGSPQQMAAMRAAVERRLAALRPLRNGMLVLREVMVRGQSFGLDPHPTREQVQALFAAKPAMGKAPHLVDLLADWEFVWGEPSPMVSEWVGSLLADAMTSGVSTVRPDDIDRIQQRVLSLEPAQQREAKLQHEVLGIQIRVRTDALRWRLANGDQRRLAEAWELWQEYERQAVDDQRLRPGRVPALGIDLARLHILAARTAMAANKRVEAVTIIERLLALGPSAPLAAFAQSWRMINSGCGEMTDATPSSTEAMDPAIAVRVGRMWLEEAKSTTDPVVARRELLQAAAILRGGILGLQAQRDDVRSTSEHLAQLYLLYVQTLTRLELRHHAVIAALAGTDQALTLIDRLERQKQPNPWKRATTDGRLTWDEQRITPLRLASDGLIIANQLKVRDPRMSQLYLAAIARLGRLDPASKGGDLIRPQIAAQVEEGDYEGALREAEQLVLARPEQDAWVSGVRNRVAPLWAEHLRRLGEPAKAESVLARLTRDNAAMASRAQAELMNPETTSARRQELERALWQIQFAEIEVLSARQDYSGAIERITTLLGDNVRLEGAQVQRLQERLAQAVGQWIEAQNLTTATPLEVMHGVIERLDQLRARIQSPTAEPMSITVAKRMAVAYVRLRGALPSGTAATMNAEAQRLIRLVDRGFAESFTVAIDDQTPAGNLLALGAAWFDLGEFARAVEPLERAITKTMADANVADFLRDTRSWLSNRTDVITTRTEFRERWHGLVLACVGDGTGRGIDWRSALSQLTDLRTRIDASRQILGGDQHLRLITALAEVEGVVRKVVEIAFARSRLAVSYRDVGRPDMAIPHLQHLRVLEPENSDHRLALVLATVSASPQLTSRADLEQARVLAAGIRDDRQGTTDKVGYWEASVLVLELSLLLGDQRLVDDTLAFMKRNRSDPSRDLIDPPVPGDDRRIRRSLGKPAVALARRFLDLFGKPGITTQPPFRIEEVVVGSGNASVFVDRDSPTPRAQATTTPDGHPVVVFVIGEGPASP